MTFGLRNAGATFQHCMQKCLLKQLGRNAHVYVDDIVVKTEKRGTLLEDLRNIRQLAPIPNQAQPREVRVRSTSRPAARLPGL